MSVCVCGYVCVKGGTCIDWRTSRCACGASPQRSANVACALQGKHGAGQPSAYHLGVPSTFTRWEVCWNCSAWALRARRLTSEVSAMSSKIVSK